MRRTLWTPTVSPVGTLLVSSLVVAGIMGCTALPSFISGEPEEEAVGTLGRYVDAEREPAIVVLRAR